jgi:hypothetical protein
VGTDGSASDIFIQAVVAPPLTTSGQACVFSASPTQATRASGVLDVSLKQNYFAEYLVGNRLPEGSGTLSSQPGVVIVQGATLRITDAAGNELATDPLDAYGTIEPESGDVPGYYPVQVEPLNSSIISSDAQIQTTVVDPPPGAKKVVRLFSYVRIFGTSLGGRYEESEEFAFPIDVCDGCLVGPQAACVAPDAGVSIPCFPGQDDPVNYGLVHGACGADADGG